VGISVGVGYILYYEGLKRIKAAQVSAIELSTPPFVVLLGFLIPSDSVEIMQYFGIVMLVVGVHFLSRKEETYF
jgi:drug/metabolite transporter (DMT)-like permease